MFHLQSACYEVDSPIKQSCTMRVDICTDSDCVSLFDNEDTDKTVFVSPHTDILETLRFINCVDFDDKFKISRNCNLFNIASFLKGGYNQFRIIMYRDSLIAYENAKVSAAFINYEHSVIANIIKSEWCNRANIERTFRMFHDMANNLAFDQQVDNAMKELLGRDANQFGRIEFRFILPTAYGYKHYIRTRGIQNYAL